MIKKQNKNPFNFNSNLLIYSKNILGASKKKTNFKLHPYIQGFRYKFYIISTIFLKNAFLKNFKLLYYILINKKNVLIIGNSSDIQFFMDDLTLQKHSNIFYYKQSWINGFLTNKNPYNYIKQNNIQFIVLLKMEKKKISEIINEIYKLNIPFMLFVNTDFTEIKKVSYPVITNFIFSRPIFFILYFFKKILFYATLSTKK